MKVYLASSFLNKYNARQAMTLLELKGHTITYDWTVNQTIEDPRSPLWAEHAEKDMQGVKDCEVFILLWPGRYSSNSEFGMALALGKPTILVGGVDKDINLFYHHRSVRFAPTISDAITMMRWI